MSASQNITFVRGQTEEWTLNVLNADGSACDLSTALAVELEVKPRAGAPDPASLHLDQSAGIVVRAQTGADIGLCDVTATSTQTFALAAGACWYDVFVTRADSARKLVMSGFLTVADVANFPG